MALHVSKCKSTIHVNIYIYIYIYIYFCPDLCLEENIEAAPLLNTPDFYQKEILDLYGFVISVSHISLCVMVDRTLIIEFDYRKTVLNMGMD